jgi:peptide-methionine (R)-S-oxide reductase
LDNIKNDEYWIDKLSKSEFDVCRKKGTEYPFTGKYDKFYENGIYICKCCKKPLFSSKSKFDSGSGWPSFYESIENGAIKYEEDGSLAVKRVEILCSNCNAHLGHVFDDGFGTPTNKRYCVNSISLEFKESGE